MEKLVCVVQRESEHRLEGSFTDEMEWAACTWVLKDGQHLDVQRGKRRGSWLWKELPTEEKSQAW